MDNSIGKVLDLTKSESEKLIGFPFSVTEFPWEKVGREDDASQISLILYICNTIYIDILGYA